MDMFAARLMGDKNKKSNTLISVAAINKNCIWKWKWKAGIDIKINKNKMKHFFKLYKEIIQDFQGNSFFSI